MRRRRGLGGIVRRGTRDKHVITLRKKLHYLGDQPVGREGRINVEHRFEQEHRPEGEHGKDNKPADDEQQQLDYRTPIARRKGSAAAPVSFPAIALFQGIAPLRCFSGYHYTTCCGK